LVRHPDFFIMGELLAWIAPTADQTLKNCAISRAIAAANAAPRILIPSILPAHRRPARRRGKPDRSPRPLHPSPFAPGWCRTWGSGDSAAPSAVSFLLHPSRQPAGLGPPGAF